MSDADIKISSYDPNWPLLFEQEKNKLIKVLNDPECSPIEHVGSTSVKGLAAKPIIDIMVGVTSLENSHHVIPKLCDYGYCYYPYKPDVMHWFCKPTPEVRTHHLHLIPYQSPLWQERIKFRDILRSNAIVRDTYAALKYDLAKTHTQDREQYTKQKWPFIKQVLEDY